MINHVLKKLKFEVTKKELKDVQSKLLIALAEEFEEVTENRTLPMTIHHSIACKFYSPEKITAKGISVGRFKYFKFRTESEENGSICFHAQGLKNRQRAIQPYGFDYAFDEVFDFGCTQLKIWNEAPSVLLFKSILKAELLKQAVSLGINTKRMV